MRSAFAARRVFLLPNTLDLDGRISSVQRLRFARTRLKWLLAHHSTLAMSHAFRNINAHSRAGDLVDGGHLDFATVRDWVRRPLKIITILRDPYERARSEYNYARWSYHGKSGFGRLDCGLLPKVAAKYDFAGYLAFLSDHSDVYGNVACAYIGWDGKRSLADFARSSVFHCGVLERPQRFAQILSEKIGVAVSLPHHRRTGEIAVQTVDRGERRVIERLYARDLELYEHFSYA